MKIHPSSVFVDYSKSLNEMIEEGNFDWVEYAGFDFDLMPTKRRKNSTLSLSIINYGCKMSTQAVLDDFNHRKIVPADPPELLALGRKYPHLQQKFNLIELGWSFEDNQIDKYLTLISVDSERFLGFDWVDSDGRWCQKCWFVGVHI